MNVFGNHNNHPGHSATSCELNNKITAAFGSTSSNGYGCYATGGHCIPTDDCERLRQECRQEEIYNKPLHLTASRKRIQSLDREGTMKEMKIKEKELIVEDGKKYRLFYESVSCLIVEGVEFMNKIELYNAIKKEWHICNGACPTAKTDYDKLVPINIFNEEPTDKIAEIIFKLDLIIEHFDIGEVGEGKFR